MILIEAIRWILRVKLMKQQAQIETEFFIFHT